MRQLSQFGRWSEVRFSEAVLINPTVQLDRGGVYPFVDMAAVNVNSRSAYAVEERAFQGSGSRFQVGDTLMARITPCLENGKIARYCAPDNTQIAHGSTEFIVIRGHPGTTDNDFAFYLTRWNEVREYAIDQMTGTSGRQRVPVDSLDHLIVPIPPISEQRTIAHILGTLDDKIELNRRMNETLEEMARTLFKSWFVDFDPVRAKAILKHEATPPQRGSGWTVERARAYLDRMDPNIAALFPDRFVDSELGPIPKAWEVGTLGKIADQRRCGVSPHQIDPDTPYIGLEHMPKRCIALSEWGSAEGLASSKFSFEERDILFGKLRPYFHKIGIAPLGGVCSTDIVVMSPVSDDWFGFVLGHASSSKFVDYTDATSTGTKMPRTNWTDMSRYQIPLPGQELAECFNKSIQPAIDRIVSSIHESLSLTAVRETLLPKIISGELRVGSHHRLRRGYRDESEFAAKVRRVGIDASRS